MGKYKKDTNKFWRVKREESEGVNCLEVLPVLC